MNKGKLYGIGIGPGDPDLITLKAVKALKKADIIYVPKSKEQESTALNIIQTHLPENATVMSLEFPMSKKIQTRLDSRKSNAELIINNLKDGLTSVFLTLGDPMLYSTYSYVLEHIGSSFEVETIPGIYSFAAISSILSKPLCKGDEKLAVISSFDENTPSLLETVHTIICMKVSAYGQSLYEHLNQNPPGYFAMITDVGKPNQRIHNTLEILNGKIPYFSTAILQKN